MSEEGRNPWAARDAGAAKGSADAPHPDGSADETQVLSSVDQPTEAASPAPEPLVPPAPSSGGKPGVVPTEPFAPPTSAGEEEAEEPAAHSPSHSSGKDPKAPEVKGVPTRDESPSPLSFTAGPTDAPRPPRSFESVTPPISTQPSLDPLRPKRDAAEPLHAEALVSEDTDTRDRQIRQLRIFAGAALALAVIALVVAFSHGGSHGTVDTDQIAADAVTSTQIADGAVTSSKIAPGVVTAGKRGPEGVTGPQGPIGHIGKTGPAGAPGITAVQSVTKQTPTDSDPDKTLTVTCPAGKSVLYGGATLTGATSNVGLQSSGPAADGTEAWTADAAAFTTTATTGQAKGTTTAPTSSGDWGLTVSVTCATFAKNNAATPSKNLGQGGLKAGAGETVKPVNP